MAQKLGFTKQAIYRHFRGKSALLEAMKNDFLLAYGEVRDAVTAAAGKTAGSRSAVVREALAAYAGGIYDMFQRVPAYYYYLVLKLLPGPEEDRRRFLELGDDISAALGPLPAGATELQRTLPLVFVHIHVVVWTAFAFWTPLGQARNGNAAPTAEHNAAEPNAAQRRAAHVAHTVELCLHGHFPRARHDLPYGQIERIAEVQQAELLEPNRFFAAVETVVAEVGFEAASLERIAGSLGMSKSSLYFHFENKDTMFSAALQRERSHFRDLFARRAAQLEDFSASLYGYIVALVTFLLSNRSLMVFSNWAQIQHIPVGGSIPDEAELLQTAEFLQRRLAACPDPQRRGETLETLALLSILVQRGIIDYNLSFDRRDELFDFTRVLYRTVSHGIAPQQGADGRGGVAAGRAKQAKQAKQAKPDKGRTRQL